MKKLIWKIIYKIIERWRRVAKRNRLDEQELDCIRILVALEMYKGHMQEKGLWQERKKRRINMKKLLILALSLILLTTTRTTAKTVTKPKLTMASNYVTEDKTARKIKVTWTKIKSAKPYQIQRSCYKDFHTVASTVNTSRTSRTYSLTNSNNFGKDYYIRVRTKQNNGKFGAWSNVVKAKGIAVKEEPVTEEEKQELKAPVPCLVKHERTDRTCTIRIEWDAVEGAKSYEVQRSIYSDFREHEDTVTKKTKNTYYECTASGSGVAPIYGPAKQTYYLRVRAVAEDGTVSNWSGTVVARGSYSLEQ